VVQRSKRYSMSGPWLTSLSASGHAHNPGGSVVDTNVLIVDDSSVMVDTLNTILASQGWHVQTCDSGEAGWKHLVAGAQGNLPMPDVMLLDLNMPGVDGMTLLDRIRSEEQFANLSVIVVTAETDTETRTEALGAGADDYLCKPVEVSELLARVKLYSNGNS